jgi:RNA polymerase sigma factor (sigma-70 family)
MYMYTTTVKHPACIDRRVTLEPNQTAAAQVVVSPVPTIWPPAAPDGFEEFFRRSFRELVRAAMYAGATLEEAEDATAKALMEMLWHWDTCKRSLAYARKAAVHNFIKDKTRGTGRVARRLIDRGHVPCQEGAEDSQLTAWEDEEWVAHVLSSLPAAQREVMELIAKGLDRDEIAETLGKTREAIRQMRIPIESDHLFRSNPIADSGVSDHLAGAGVS